MANQVDSLLTEDTSKDDDALVFNDDKFNEVT